MDLLLNILAIAMGVFGFILLFGGVMNKHLGLVLAGINFSVGAFIAYKIDSFIPLIIAVVISFVLRKLGFDPSQ